MTNSDIFAGLSRGQFLSKTGNCQTYDNDADGYCRGDGIGTLIIKRLEDAETDNDRILGVILQTATNHSANAISITHPHAPTQETLFQKVVEEAGVDPHDINYVEMHGYVTSQWQQYGGQAQANKFKIVLELRQEMAQKCAPSPTSLLQRHGKAPENCRYISARSKLMSAMVRPYQV